MGNRGGRIHDPETRTLGASRWVSKRWISCVLSFRDRQREVWGAGYTELFFLDEVTALAAGHRPCFECRHHDAHAFAEALSRSLGVSGRLGASEIDERLHAERLDGRSKRLHRVGIASLPDGAVVRRSGEPWAVIGDRILRWSPEGYTHATDRPTRGEADLLTPPTVLLALSEGFQASWHPSANSLTSTRPSRESAQPKVVSTEAAIV